VKNCPYARNCFKCGFPDCILDSVTLTEKKAAARRDKRAEKDFLENKQFSRAPSETETRAQRYYWEHREEVLARKRLYYMANRAKIEARKKVYREMHREEIAAYQHQYYLRSKGAI